MSILSKYLFKLSLSKRSAYFALISNRFASWGSGALSPQASLAMTVMNPLDIESIQVARTQPEVVKPPITKVSIFKMINLLPNLFQKKH